MPPPKTKPPICLVMMTPVFFTVSGKRPWAWLTRFCTSTAARSTLRVTSNVTVIWLVPSLPLLDVMYFMPCTPLIACSSGIVTADSTVCAFAPMYPLDTTTCGGAKSGNCAMGSEGIEIAPPKIISSAQTVAKTGRRMKKSTNKDQPTLNKNLRLLLAEHGTRSTKHEARSTSSLLARRSAHARCRLPIHNRLHHGCAIVQKLQSRHDDVIAFLEAVLHGVVVANRVANMQQLLPRNGFPILVLRQKREELTVDARHCQDRNYRALMRSPNELCTHLLRDSQRRPRILHRRLRQHRLRIRIDLRRNKRDFRIRQIFARRIHQVHRHADAQIPRAIRRHVNVRLDRPGLIDRRQQRRYRNAIADAHRDVTDNPVRRRRHGVVVQFDLLRRDRLLERFQLRQRRVVRCLRVVVVLLWRNARLI